jgi:hypothetical protein
MQPWQRVWRDGIAPLLSREQLHALARALESDDPRLIQGATTIPPPLQCVQDWPCEGACPLGFCAALEHGGFLKRADGLPIKPPHEYATVSEVENGFSILCWKCDERLGEPAAVRFFISWYDETPRDEMRPALLAEVNLALERTTP